ncbi:MAG: hypothetical protein RR555_05190 [Bacteroidales bacterium]
MKKLILLFIVSACVALTSCVKDNTGTHEPTQPEDKALTERLTTSTVMQVPVQTGKITVVTYAGDTLCIATGATSIMVPKTGAISKADDPIKISYINESDPNYAALLKDGDKSGIWQTLVFEDSKNADHDYNDLVLHVRYQRSFKANNDLFCIGVQPIAFGATKLIKLGCEIIYKGQSVFNEIISQNAKNDFFTGTTQAQLINTYNMDYQSPLFTKVFAFDAKGVEMGEIRVIWYIQVDGENVKEGQVTLYAVNDKYSFTNKEKRPYGIIITDASETLGDHNLEHTPAWFSYPKEQINISDCYPGFDGWISGSAQTFNTKIYNIKNIFNIVQKLGKEPKMLYEMQSNGLEKPDSGRYKDITKHYPIQSL